MKTITTTLALGAVLGAPCAAQTTQIGPSEYRIGSGVSFELGNAGASDFLFNWGDAGGTFTNIVDPTIYLTEGETYTFVRATSSHPFIIMDDDASAFISGTDGSYQRTTTDGALLDAATLAPIADFTADPAPSGDVITWTPAAGQYWYTCRVTGHLGMTGRIVVQGVADPRDVQIRSIDFENETLELFNFGALDQDLSGWRFCTHDTDEQRRYSASGGLNGVIIEAGTSVVVHYANDAPASPDAINRSDIGGAFATPLDPDAYGAQIFFPDPNGNISFGNSNLIGDALAWSIPGDAVGNAAVRLNQAESVGLWIDDTDLIDSNADAVSITLTDTGDGRLHGPDNYTVEVATGCAADFNGDGVASFPDVGLFLAAFSAGAPEADFNGDGSVSFPDVGLYLAAFAAGCP